VNLIKHFKKDFILHYLGHAYNDIYFLILPLLIPFIRNEFGLNYFQSGLILTTHIGMRSLFSYICGHLGDKYDKRTIISAGFIFSSVFMASLMLANTYYTVMISLMIMAVGVAAFHPLATALVGEEAEAKFRALQIGVFESIGAGGIILGTITFGFFVDSWGWRHTCLVLAVPGLLLAFAYLKMRKEEIDYNIEAEIEVDNIHILTFLAGRGIRALGIGAIMSFLPTFGADYLGYGGGDTSWLMALFFAGCIIGNLSGGLFSDKKTPLLIISLSTILTILTMLGITYLHMTGLVLIFVIMLGASHGGFFTPQNSWLTTVSTQSSRGKVLGAAFLIDGVSVTAAPTLFGWIADHIGLLGSFRWTLLPIFISFFFFSKLYYLEIKNELTLGDTSVEMVSD